jgi:aspartate/methionine/tyrosine aminotransferase
MLVGQLPYQELLEQAREMEGRGEVVVHMEIGEPDFETPPVCERGRNPSHQG